MLPSCERPPLKTSAMPADDDIMPPLSLLSDVVLNPRVGPPQRILLRPRFSSCSTGRRYFHEGSRGPRHSVQKLARPDEYSFERLSLNRNVLKALRLAFPSVKHPTHIQYHFIESVLRGKDVLLKDKTGSGKYEHIFQLVTNVV